MPEEQPFVRRTAQLLDFLCCCLLHDASMRRQQLQQSTFGTATGWRTVHLSASGGNDAMWLTRAKQS
jgi:hypothetical protein